MSGTVHDPAACRRLLGQAATVDAFERAHAAGRLPHGLALLGPRGVGKASFAYRAARRLLAGPGTPPEDADDPTGAVFRMVANRAHPDLRFLVRTTDPKSGRLRREITVDQVRAVNEQLHHTATGLNRVLVVDSADELNHEAANALLKLLEEPPPRVFLLLVVQRPGRLPRTILSRCAQLRLQPLPEPLMRQGLARLLPELDGTIMARLLSLAGGSLGRAIELHASGWCESYARLIEAMAAGGPSDRLRAADLLVGRAQSEGISAAAELLDELLRRTARTLAGQTLPELADAEQRTIGRIGERHGLAGTVALWEKQTALVGRVETLNLDPLQVFVRLVEAIAGEPRAAVLA